MPRHRDDLLPRAIGLLGEADQTLNDLVSLGKRELERVNHRLPRELQNLADRMRKIVLEYWQ